MNTPVSFVCSADDLLGQNSKNSRIRNWNLENLKNSQSSDNLQKSENHKIIATESTAPVQRKPHKKPRVNTKKTRKDTFHYLQDNVIDWMTSLRSETHDYHNFEAPDATICNPKSIPSKGNFSCCGFPNEVGVPFASFVASSSSFENNNNYNSLTFDEILDRSTLKNSLDSNLDLDPTRTDLIVITQHQQMVDDFKRNLMEKNIRKVETEHTHKQQLAKRRGIYLKLDKEQYDDLLEAHHHQRQNQVVVVGDEPQPRTDIEVEIEADDDRVSLFQRSQQSQSLPSTLDSVRSRRGGAALYQSSNRNGFCEKDSDFVNDILTAFETFLKRDNCTQNSSSEVNELESKSTLEVSEDQTISCEQENSQSATSALVLVNSNQNSEIDRTLSSAQVFVQQINISSVISHLTLSRSLNKILLTYDKHLRTFLSGIGSSRDFQRFCADREQLVKIFLKWSGAVGQRERFNRAIVSGARRRKRPEIAFRKQEEKDKSMKILTNVEADTKILLYGAPDPLKDGNTQMCSTDTSTESEKIPEITIEPPSPTSTQMTSSLSPNKPEITPRKTINSQTIIKVPRKPRPPPPPRTSFTSAKMTVPTAESTTNASPSPPSPAKPEEDIYQPIWKFKTVGEPRSTYNTDDESCDEITTRSDSPGGVRAEDHGDWEIDDEFMFSKKIRSKNTTPSVADTMSVKTNASASTASLVSLTSSIRGRRTIVDPYQTICIIYSPTNPKFRAVIYDYAWPSSDETFVCRKPTNRHQPGCGSNGSDLVRSNQPRQQNPIGNAPVAVSSESAESRRRRTSIPDCVQAWKFMLLDINYMEDEEDMFVSENEISKLTQNETPDPLPAQPFTATSESGLKLYKTASIDNLFDAIDDKKTVADSIRNKFQRGFLKLNVRQPGVKKLNRLLKRTDASSLYLEDGMKPKYPIFGAELAELEMDNTVDSNVPRFVVDCIKIIEQKDCIQMDGLYRASGNKVAIDELKRKLTESYIYDSRLLKTDDIHTLTSLLKQFFRESKTALIPPESYRRLPENLVNSSNLHLIKNILLDIKDPSRSTLKYLLKHLTLVSQHSSLNRMPASNLAIVWGPCILSANALGPFDIARMNTLAKVLIENYDKIYGDNERLVS